MDVEDIPRKLMLKRTKTKTKTKDTTIHLVGLSIGEMSLRDSNLVVLSVIHAIKTLEETETIWERSFC
jgi:hypothetical protein